MRLLPGLPGRDIGRAIGRAIVCQQAVELVTDYLEGRLRRSARRRFERHLGTCPHCAEYLAQMRETIRLTGLVAPEDLTEQMRDDLIRLFQQWKAGER
jgi:anti-sigma factor RsiW